MPRFYCPAELQTGLTLELPPGPARHVQVLRLQPGDAITLFNHGPDWDGLDKHQGGEFEALSKSEIALANQADFVVEMAQYEIYKNQKLESDVIDFFRHYGYKCVYPKTKKAHYDALFLSENSQKIYFKKRKILQRFLSYQKSKFVSFLYICKKHLTKTDP